MYTGTDGGLCAYISRGQVIYRFSNPIESKRIKTDPAFEGFRRSTSRLKQASPIAAGLYNQIPGKDKVYSLYRLLTGEAIKMLKEGTDTSVIKEILQRTYIDPILNKPVRCKQGTMRRKKPRRGCFAFSGMRFFRNDSCSNGQRSRRIYNRRAMQPADGPVAEQEWKQGERHYLELTALLESLKKRPQKSTQRKGLIYLGRDKEFPGLKMWMMTAEYMMDLSKSLKTSKYISLWDGATRI